ncbi:MAG: EF-hand domain-containing protein [Vampirovibrionales bacterium]
MNLLQPLVTMLWQVKASKLQQGLFQSAGTSKTELESFLSKVQQQNLYSRGMLSDQQARLSSLIANFDDADTNADGRIDSTEWQRWQQTQGSTNLLGSTATGWQGVMERLLLNQGGGNNLGGMAMMGSTAAMANVQNAGAASGQVGANPMISLNTRMQSLLDNRYTSMSSSFDF